MTIDIRDNIPDAIAVECVMHVVRAGKISVGERGKHYYCWAEDERNGEYSDYWNGK